MRITATCPWISPIVAAGVLVALSAGAPAHAEPVAGGTQDPTTIEKYREPLVIPPAMPRSGVINSPVRQRLDPGGEPLMGVKKTDVYNIAVRQFQQQVLPSGNSCDGAPCPMTTVWGYGSVTAPGTVAEGGSFNFPAFTIEAKYRQTVRVKWINDLVDENGDFLSHLLPVDQTLHWANPVGLCKDGTMGTDCRGTNPTPYTGPVPMIVHVHGAETHEWADGYPEAWYLPDLGLNTRPADILFSQGSFYNTFLQESPIGHLWEPGTAVFEYPNDMRATTLWYHDHTLGMTRQNVYAGPAGFFILRGGPDDAVRNGRGRPATLPGPAPALGDPPGLDYYEIPIVIQDRSFDSNGELFYPDNRAFFEGLDPAELQIPFIPDDAEYPTGENLGPSDVSPIWNPEFFGNTMVVNGRTWPHLEVEQRRYRFRFLNGCNSRFLILKTSNDMTFWQIGAEGGFLPAPVPLTELLMGPAERADVIMDFRNVPRGTEIVLLNLGPDEPFGGGVPVFGCDPDVNPDCFEPSDPGTTGQVMAFRVVKRKGPDRSTPPDDLRLPPITPLGLHSRTRVISLNEEESGTIRVTEDAFGNVVLDIDGEEFGPTEALLGTVNPDGTGNPLGWSALITENPDLFSTEVWEIRNFTADAHPIHIHLVQFQVVEREEADGTLRPPEAWETGFKDTVIAYPDEITRVKARFDLAGLFVWHCHILEHEDNEMMRPYCVSKADGSLSAACQQAGVE